MPKSVPVIDKKIIERFKLDDMYAFDIIYRAYNKKVFLFAYSIIKEKEDAEGIVHDVFIKIWEEKHKIDEYLSFESYLFTITHNTTLSLIRLKLKEKKYVEHLKSIQKITSQSDITSDIEYLELKNKSEQVINNLSKRQRQIYLLSRDEGLTYKEIAARLGISVNTVETHMQRALQQIKDKLGRFSSISILFFILFV